MYSSILCQVLNVAVEDLVSSDTSNYFYVGELVKNAKYGCCL